MKEKFESIVSKLLQEAPAPAAPPKPATKPSTAPSKPTTRPAPGNPNPFRRHQPGQMPEIKPKASNKRGAAEELKQELQSILQKHSKFLKA